VYGKEKKKEKLKKKEKKKKKERAMARKIWRGWIKWRINKVRETKLPFFFQPCAIRQRRRHWCLVVLFCFALAHVHHSVSSYPWYFYIMV
jgi:hypothetical protein